ncbi:unnamed protein product [Triticum turgidum subsp. durum]|uniref:Uncharacterized protein n=1 Tax=Triticum turgidum subsp. durum TaxID=4567 RepID=A0A9R0RKY5_TRITD|nr:unnamed protein product [Triticum turgidum subsp. durum]
MDPDVEHHGSRCGAPLWPDLTWERLDPCVSASLRAPPWSAVFPSAGAALSRRRPVPWSPPSRTMCHGRLPASPASGTLHPWPSILMEGAADVGSCLGAPHINSQHPYMSPKAPRDSGSSIGKAPRTISLQFNVSSILKACTWIPYSMQSSLMIKSWRDTRCQVGDLGSDAPITRDQGAELMGNGTDRMILQSFSQALVNDDGEKDIVTEEDVFLRPTLDHRGSLISKIATLDAQMTIARDHILRISE